MLTRARTAFIRFSQKVAIGVAGVVVLVVLGEVAPGILQGSLAITFALSGIHYIFTGRFPWEKAK